MNNNSFQMVTEFQDGYVPPTKICTLGTVVICGLLEVLKERRFRDLLGGVRIVIGGSASSPYIIFNITLRLPSHGEADVVVTYNRSRQFLRVGDGSDRSKDGEIPLDGRMPLAVRLVAGLAEAVRHRLANVRERANASYEILHQLEGRLLNVTGGQAIQKV